MRIWEKIKVDSVVIYRGEKYVVLKIYEFDEERYGEIKRLSDGIICKVPLHSCILDWQKYRLEKI